MLNPETVIKSILDSTTTEIIRFFDSEDISFLKKLWYWCNDKYYNSSETKLLDWQFDLLQEIITRRDGTWVPPIGADVVREGDRVKLPIWMGSLDKITDGKTWERWCNSVKLHKPNEFVVENKLDGVSCLIISDGNTVKMYSRGNGKIGSDISWVLEWIRYIPPVVRNNIRKNIFIIRGELIIPKEIFKNKWATKYSTARNMVSGLVNSKQIPEGIEDVCFIAYEWISKTGMQDGVLQQLKKLQDAGWYTVRHFTLPSDWKFSDLPVVIQREKETSPWEIDGIVLHHPGEYKRLEYDNPKHCVALKDNSILTSVETDVIGVEWNISKSGKLKPTILLNPITIDGVTIKRTSGYNARYITSMNIGIGTIVRIVRSGDVIPKIMAIIKPTKPLLPDIGYFWDDQGVDIILLNESSEKQKKQLISFFKMLEIHHLGPKTIDKLWDGGFRTLEDIVNISSPQLEKILNSSIMGNKIRGELDKIGDLSLEEIIGASGKLGNGISIKKIKKLFKNNLIMTCFENLSMDCLPSSQEDIINIIKKCDGFSDKTASLVTYNLKDTIEWLKKMNVRNNNTNFEHITSDNEKIDGIWVFSGVRDSNLSKILNTTPTVSSKVSGVIVKTIPPRQTEKVKKAIELNIPIIPIEHFKSKYVK